MPLEPELVARVRAYADDDPDEGDRAELLALLERGDDAELRARFAAPLGFGTAGLRGAIGAGPSRINRAVVARTTAGACLHLLASVPDARARGLCIGFDARHRSRALAEETAEVAAGLGVRVWLFAQPVPTPLLAFAVLDTRAAAGVMITASHNPASDNGYKLYWKNGAQVIPPDDRAIEAAMHAIPSVRALARIPRDARRAQGLEMPLGAATEARYLAGIDQLAAGRAARSDRSIHIAYTALHGVGEPLVRRTLAAAGFAQLESVAEQAVPDPDFPTVSLPNPEEPGAMDRVLALAEQSHAALVLASDPDADRLAVAARHDGALRVLSGNEVGALLTEYRLSRAVDPSHLSVLASIVSSPLIGVIARAHGAHYEPTLTGFKWIENRALELQATRGLYLAIGVEEAIGYSIGTLVRDKDGISAARIIAELAAELAATGRSLFDTLDALALQHGVYSSRPLSLRVAGQDGIARMAALMARMRAAPPGSLAGFARTALADLLTGELHGAGTTLSTLPQLPRTDAILWELQTDIRIALRPSGTEPKLKVYIDLRTELGPGESLAQTRARASARADALETAVSALLHA